MLCFAFRSGGLKKSEAFGVIFKFFGKFILEIPVILVLHAQPAQNQLGRRLA